MLRESQQVDIFPGDEVVGDERGNGREKIPIKIGGEHTDHIHIRDSFLKYYLSQLPEQPTVKDYDELIARLEREKVDVGSGQEVREERTVLGSVILRIRKRRDKLAYSQREL